MKTTMKENVMKQPTPVENVTKETYCEEGIVKNVAEDLKEPEYVISQSLIGEEEIEGDTKKTYPCNICDKVIKFKRGLKQHMKTHSKEKTSKCHMCSMSFISSSNLRTHRLTHTGEKNYSCQQCTYSSSQASNLRRHMKTHTG